MHELRRGRWWLRRSKPCTCLSPKRRSSRGTKHRRLRRVGIGRHGSGAAGQVLRFRRYGGVQHEEPRAGRIARSRRRPRLHTGGLHQERPGLRRHLRRGWQALVQTVPALTEAARDLHRYGRGVPLARSCPGLADEADRRQEGVPRDSPLLERGRSLPQAAQRGGEVPRGHRSDVPVGGGGRGDQVRRDGAEDGECRSDRQRRPGNVNAELNGPTKLTLGDAKIARIGLGTNRLTNTPANIAFVKEAVAAGIGMIDTAYTYTGGRREETIRAGPDHATQRRVLGTTGGDAPPRR